MYDIGTGRALGYLLSHRKRLAVRFEKVDKGLGTLGHLHGGMVPEGVTAVTLF